MPDKSEAPQMTQDASDADHILAQITQQTVQASQTLALHIKQHDEIETLAQERANAIIDKVAQDLNEAYQAALAQASDQIHKEIEKAQNQMEQERREFQEAYDSKLTEALNTLRDERAKESANYELLCSNTSNELKAALDGSIQANNENTHKAMESTTLQLNQAHKTQTAETVDAFNTKSQALKKFVIAAATAATIVAIALSATIAAFI